MSRLAHGVARPAALIVNCRNCGDLVVRRQSLTALNTTSRRWQAPACAREDTASTIPLAKSADEEHDFGVFFLEDAEEDKHGDAERDAEDPPGPDVVDRLGGVPNHAHHCQERKHASENQKSADTQSYSCESA